MIKNNIYNINNIYMFEPVHINNIYYMKYDKYVFEIDVYDVQNNDKENIIPHFYKILNIYDIIEDKEVDEITNLFENDFNCLTEDGVNSYCIEKHFKKLKKNMFCIYKNICNHDDAIYKNILINDNNTLEFAIISKLCYAHTNRDVAYFEDFILNEQWKNFKNGYNGVCRNYKSFLFDPTRTYLETEFFCVNGDINGEYKQYDEYNRVSVKQNYVNNKKYGEGYYYDYGIINSVITEKRLYYNNNFYYSEIIENNVIKKRSYYYFDINVTYVYKFLTYFDIV